MRSQTANFIRIVGLLKLADIYNMDFSLAKVLRLAARSSFDGWIRIKHTVFIISLPWVALIQSN